MDPSPQSRAVVLTGMGGRRGQLTHGGDPALGSEDEDELLQGWRAARTLACLPHRGPWVGLVPPLFLALPLGAP